ncbi:hypothetical protein VY617_002020 [Enterococcus faecalis]|uniref:hypothetical protein n=1 Tax=Enterococcus faecalis TaxID=1351 RepID=UPI00155E427B|nr:hypothetical protein [Enterococcus faecalis]EHM3180455.1 hypothetical protein [Enterococcus faecalis]EME6187126.1 hypothetical protein [Enterococcus faecalis]NRC93411.1 hypothetical protein [Enterococcus faecalis]NSV26804.1 hypothetical protein [Enterococcus faecalis]
MIKFKEFDVGDIHYEEQIEQFQKEHQNAEFIQITGGYTSYEKIWFKYDDGIEQPELNENQQIVLDWLKCYTEREAVTPIYAVARFWRERNELGQPSSWRLNGEQQAQVLQAFSRWAIE